MRRNPDNGNNKFPMLNEWAAMEKHKVGHFAKGGLEVLTLG